MNYIIWGYDLINGEKTSAKRFKPQPANSIKEINCIQEGIQKRMQLKYEEPIEVLVHYKIKVK
jgi:hypothetical protein